MLRKKLVAAALALAFALPPARAALGQSGGGLAEGGQAVQGFYYFSTPVPELAGQAGGGWGGQDAATGATGGQAESTGGAAAPGEGGGQAAVTGEDSSRAAEGWKPARRGLAEAARRLAERLRGLFRRL